MNVYKVSIRPNTSDADYWGEVEFLFTRPPTTDRVVSELIEYRRDCADSWLRQSMDSYLSDCLNGVMLFGVPSLLNRVLVNNQWHLPSEPCSESKGSTQVSIIEVIENE